MVYNTQTVQLISQQSFGSVNGSANARASLRYQIRPVGYGSNADIFLYNDHYKAGDTPTDMNRRFVEATNLRANADALGDGRNLIYAGDFNIQASTESMYVRLLGPGAGQVFDPVNRPGSWNNNNSMRSVHTQSPYDASNNDSSLISGGLDDRFDFQLISGEVQNGTGFDYIPGSYHAFGNNGTHRLNQPINDPFNTAQPTDVLDALARVSDHLPVVADYQLPATMEVTIGTVPPRIIQGALQAVPVDIYNGANVVAPNGADTLEFSVQGSGGVSGSFVGGDPALGNRPRFVFTLDTTMTGNQSATITASTTTPEVPDDLVTETSFYNVLEHANGSFTSSVDVDTLDVDFGIVIPHSSQQQAARLFNLFSLTDPRAALDLDAVNVSGDTSKLSSDLTPFSNLFAGSSESFSVSLDTSESGLFSAVWELSLSDEDIPGEATQMMTINATGGVALPGDANLDGFVDGVDFIIWNDNKFQGGTTWNTGDFNQDGTTDGVDFILWNDNKFTTLENLVTLVPEPSVLMLAVWAALAVARRRRSSAA